MALQVISSPQIVVDYCKGETGSTGYSLQKEMDRAEECTQLWKIEIPKMISNPNMSVETLRHELAVKVHEYIQIRALREEGRKQKELLDLEIRKNNETFPKLAETQKERAHDLLKKNLTLSKQHVFLTIFVRKMTEYTQALKPTIEPLAKRCSETTIGVKDLWESWYTPYTNKYIRERYKDSEEKLDA